MRGNRSAGTLKFDSATPKIYVEVDPAIVSLARALLPQPLKSQLKPQRYPPHISVVRNEPLSNYLHDGDPIRFLYDPEPVVGDVYAWLRVLSPDLIRLRRDLGLPDSSEWSRPPNGEECFHITIGNRKS